ncbi:DNA polymerase III subunit epsilon [Corynebacterium sp.]|uniref:DNA polymerase III subunit epsilon n=1 Tax=Corynebacterium sp. TaxID=1720 RepID=UPI0026E06244|nr:DNA polymerase III subunit epsilon [Corynebacterium sp.]MDO5513191.1 DNA polymerase III subunit epsilon [Corynebacterium sp.]
MIPAHGAQLSVTATSIRIDRSALLTALTGEESWEVPLSQVTGVRVEEPSLLDAGSLTLEGPGTVIPLAPGQAQAAEDLRAAIEAARRGEVPAAVAGLDFVAVDREVARKFIDGVETEVTSRDDALPEFIGNLPVVAHDAQFHMMMLRREYLEAGRAVPQISYVCTLILARASGRDVPMTLDARGAAELLVDMAREHNHRGSVAEFQHASGFTLGALSAAHAYPVLRDRSGARAVVQKQEQAAPAQPRRAPWQSVATPDVIPTANPDADPTGPLFGEHVTLTGDFEPHDKGRLWSAIADLGADIGKNVTKKTTILVAGTWATKTSKEKRAEELIAKGQDIQIWTGEQLIAVLGIDEDEQPPF